MTAATTAIAWIGALAVVSLAVTPAAADDLASVHLELRRTLPREALERFLASPPLVFRNVPPRASVIYRERAGGVVLLASTSTIGTGVLVSAHGDLVTSEHVVQAPHRVRGGEWIAVWFKPANGARPVTDDFVLARVIRRDPRRDLAHLRLTAEVPRSATVVPLAAGIPDVGHDVFTIGHPRTYLWSLAQGVVSQIREDYQWRYEDGLLRTATAIQTQAAVNPGSSGAPLLNDRGEMVGVVIGSAPPGPGVTLAVSVHHVRELLPEP